MESTNRCVCTKRMATMSYWPYLEPRNAEPSAEEVVWPDSPPAEPLPEKKAEPEYCYNGEHQISTTGAWVLCAIVVALLIAMYVAM